MPSTRRSFLAASAVAAASPLLARAADRKPKILLRSSWQTVNIGDIAHTPGILALLEKHLPEAEIRLWPSSVNNGVAEMLTARFPKLTIVQKPDELKTAFAECDFLLHGSGPSLVAFNHVARWHAETKKPFGVYGITFSSTDPKQLELLSAAKFAYFRDSVSLKTAKDSGVKAAEMGLAPDAAFAVDLRDDAKADAFLKANGLEAGQFLCCIPRLRNTPYWKIRNKPMTAEDDRKHAENEKSKEHDHAPHRAAIERIVKETDLKVLVCPEDESQMAVGKELIFDPLPAEVKKRVVWRDKYWLTAEAVSTYVKSAGLFGNEMHSPIMCIGNGVPAIVCRWKQQTSKGFMWRDIGLGDWLFDFDEDAELAKLPPAVLAMAKDPKQAREKAAKARDVVTARQKETMAVLAKQF